MRATFSAEDLRFHSAWLEQPSARWEALAPSWKARKAHLDELGLTPSYEKDAHLSMARGFLALQGLAWFSEEAWATYRLAGYDAVALRVQAWVPSPRKPTKPSKG